MNKGNKKHLNRLPVLIMVVNLFICTGAWAQCSTWITGDYNVCTNTTTTLSTTAYYDNGDTEACTVASVEGSANWVDAQGMIHWGSVPGIYRVFFTCPGGCSNFEEYSVDVKESEINYPITGGGTVCNGSQATITLAGSQIGLDYGLIKDGAYPAIPYSGNLGGPISWTVSEPGTYKVYANEGCSYWGPDGTAFEDFVLSGSAVVAHTSPPQVLSVQGGATICPGAVASITMPASQSGIHYQLWRNDGQVVSTIAGNGGQITWTGISPPPGNWTYQVVANNAGCSRTMTGTPAINVHSQPQAFNVGGGGPYCTEGTGTSVTLSGSQAGISYELYKDNVFVAESTQAGTGYLLVWHNLASTGTYTIKGLGACNTRRDMNNQATISPNSTAIFTVGGSGSYCLGGAGLPITLSGSEAGISYQLKKDGVSTGPVVNGTGNALAWPNQTAGTFTVAAYNSNCSVSMGTSAVITIVSLADGTNMSNAINLGNNLSCITYADQKTIGGANCFGSDYGTGGDDIFYKFTTSYPVALTASHCGSAFNTLLNVLNSSGGLVAFKGIDATTGCQEQNKLQVSIPAGTYYIVSKAATASGQGTLATQISLVMAEGLSLSPANTTLLEDQPVTLTAPEAMTSVNEWLPADNTVEATTARTARVRPGTTTTYTAKGIVNGCEATASATVVVQADNSSRNYVKETIVKAPGIHGLSELDNLSTDQKSVNASYFDGLGRNEQTVSWQASPGRKDVVQPVVYDKYGRESMRYAPYTSNSSSGQLKVSPIGTANTYNTSAHHAFYSASNDGVANDEQPYAKTIFDASPLNEVVKQGAPGAAWQPDASPSSLADKSIKSKYAVNHENEVLHFIYDNTTGSLSLTRSKYYSAGQLAVNIIIDEQAHEVREYTDKEGKVILKKVEYGAAVANKLYASTYYIYNELGDLSVVLPPEAVRMLMECSN